MGNHEGTHFLHLHDSGHCSHSCFELNYTIGPETTDTVLTVLSDSKFSESISVSLTQRVEIQRLRLLSRELSNVRAAVSRYRFVPVTAAEIMITTIAFNIEQPKVRGKRETSYPIIYLFKQKAPAAE